ncbi:hypothetical protein FHS13_001140 [Nocardiopsis algeriensis]|uniref:Uncharacterized protein n=1 Tax=Nocardiopsis algeriensis TaxID=1478215 RepID=A0A841IRF2_9ACTN|nr:hypothetical protein [Nocardiopsis algeriensis]
MPFPAPSARTGHGTGRGAAGSRFPGGEARR